MAIRSLGLSTIALGLEDPNNFFDETPRLQQLTEQKPE
jgi:hypothetical protein